MKSNCFRRFPGRLGAIVLLWALAGGAHAAELEQVLSEFDSVQNSIQTLSAEFTETTVNRMLKDPLIAEGEFYLTKPDSIRWEYSAPEEMRFVIARDQYTGYFPSQKRAEKRNIKRWSDQLFRFFGLGQGSAELAKFYRLGLGQDDEAEDGTYLLLLEPKKRRARKRVEEVRFWLDDATYLPRRVEYRGSDGNQRTIEFHEIRVNPDLAAGIYTVDLPEDVTVTKGFSGLPNFTPDAAQ
jgi:outer membrane lipoprotein carrier protein